MTTKNIKDLLNSLSDEKKSQIIAEALKCATPDDLKDFAKKQGNALTDQEAQELYNMLKSETGVEKTQPSIGACYMCNHVSC